MESSSREERKKACSPLTASIVEFLDEIDCANQTTFLDSIRLLVDPRSGLQAYLPTVVQMYCGYANPNKREHLYQYLREIDAISKIDPNVFAECIKWTMKFNEHRQVGDVLKVLKLQIKHVNFQKLNKSGWLSIIDAIFEARSIFQLEKKLQEFDYAMHPYIQQCLQSGFGRISIIRQLHNNPDYLKVLPAAGLIIDELQDKSMSPEYRSIINELFFSLSTRIKNLTEDEATQLQSTQFLLEMVRFYMSERSSANLGKTVEILLSSTSNHILKLANHLIELCVQHNMAHFLSNQQINDDLVEFYEALWSLRPEKMLLYFNESIALDYLLRVLSNMENVLNYQVEKILEYLKRNNIFRAIDEFQASIDKKLVAALERIVMAIPRHQ